MRGGDDIALGGRGDDAIAGGPGSNILIGGAGVGLDGASSGPPRWFLTCPTNRDKKQVTGVVVGEEGEKGASETAGFPTT